MSHAQQVASLAALRALENQQLEQAAGAGEQWTPLRACIQAAGHACQPQVCFKANSSARPVMWFRHLRIVQGH